MPKGCCFTSLPTLSSLKYRKKINKIAVRQLQCSYNKFIPGGGDFYKTRI